VQGRTGRGSVWVLTQDEILKAKATGGYVYHICLWLLAFAGKQERYPLADRTEYFPYVSHIFTKKEKSSLWIVKMPYTQMTIMILSWNIR